MTEAINECKSRIKDSRLPSDAQVEQIENQVQQGLTQIQQQVNDVGIDVGAIYLIIYFSIVLLCTQSDIMLYLTENVILCLM